MPEASILQLGPGLSVRGGVSTVERLIVEHAGSTLTIHHVATMEDGSRWRKLSVFWNAVLTLRRALRAPGRLVVHIHFASRGSTFRKLLLAWMTIRARRPLILHAHGGRFDQFFAGLPGVLRKVICNIFRRADCFVVLSTQWRDFYIRQCGLHAGRILVLHNPIAIPPTVPARGGRADVRFVYLGRMSAGKGCFDLLEAFSTLRPELRDRARLIFAGDGELEVVRERARALGDRVEVHGWLDHEARNAVLEAGDVFVLPSYAEGVPMSLLEAMAYGLPVITTAVGGIPDIVADRCEGLVIRPGDIPALQAAMTRMIEDEPFRILIGRYARSRAQTFDVEKYSADLVRVYRRLLGGYK
jgi:glycosyltransferase involved in cell wall biosynthesis